MSRAATALAANVYVLALEDSCVYWMAHGFVLEENARLQARLNIFPDTHLLRRQGDAEDPGDEADLVAAANDEGEEGEEGAEGDGGGDDDDAAAAAAAAEEEEDWALQAATAARRRGGAGGGRGGSGRGRGGGRGDAGRPSALHGRRADGGGLAERGAACGRVRRRRGPPGAEQEEQEAMRAAIELSLHETKSDGGS